MSSRFLPCLFLGFLALTQLGGNLPADNEAPPAPAIEPIKRQAERGDIYAQLQMAQAYSQGKGVSKDAVQSAAWYLKAARRGSADAEFHLGYAYANGEGVDKDAAQSFAWYLKAAQQGVTLAQLAVGSDYFYGIGRAKDIAQSIDWYRKAAVQGNADAQVRLGVAYLTAKRSPEEIEKGFTYLLYRAKGDGYAAYWIACCYQSGIFVSADPILAYVWGLHASLLDKSVELANFMTDAKAKLSSQQLQEAEKCFQSFPLFLAGVIQDSGLTCTFTQGPSNLIHFEWVMKNILIPIEAPDHRPSYLIFDTGAGGSLLTKSFAGRLGLKGNSYLPLVGIGEDLGLSTISDPATIALPGMTFDHSRWGIVSGLKVDAALGKPVVGIIGMDLVRSFVIRINFIDRTIEFIPLDQFQPPAAPWACLPLTIKNGVEFVDATVTNGIAEATGTFMIDTGDNGAIDFFKFFQDQNPYLGLKSFARGGATGIGGLNYSSVGTCTSFRLGDYTLTAPVVNFERATQGLGIGINGGKIGNEVWRRFDLVLDLPNQKLYLQKNAHFKDPYEHAGAGMHVQASGEHYEILTVREVLPGSPAARAGFQTGDVLVKLQELGSAPFTLENVHHLLKTPGTCHFVIKRRGEIRSLVLQLDNPVVPSSASTVP